MDKIKCTGTFDNDNEIALEEHITMITDFFEKLAWYTDGTGMENSYNILKDIVKHVADTECYDAQTIIEIMKRIADNGKIACGAGQIIFEGLIKTIEW